MPYISHNSIPRGPKGNDGAGIDITKAELLAIRADAEAAAARAEQVAATTGASAYQIAVNNGFVGTEAQWLASLEGPAGPSNGPAGPSAYEVAVANGFTGTEAQWLASLVGTVPDATTTTKGVARFPTAAEITTGTATNLHPSVKDLVAWFAAHSNDLEGAHPDYYQAITALQLALGNAVTAPVPHESLADVAVSGVPDSLAKRNATGGLQAAAALTDAELATLGQVRELATFTAGADVRDLDGTGLPLALSTSTTTWTTIPGPVWADAESGEEVECYLAVKYRSAAGIRIRHKGGAAAVTSLYADQNPSFEDATTAPWTVSGPATLSRGTTGGGFDGAAYGILTATGSGSLTLTGPWAPIGSTTQMSAGSYGRLHAGTARNLRTDIQYATDANGTGTTTDLGAGSGIVAVTSTGWTRSTNGVNAPSVPPAGATHARVRVVYPGAVAADAVRIDAINLEASSPLPAYGSTGGSGASALSVDGSYSGLTLAASSSDGYSRKELIRTPSVAAPANGFEFGSLGDTTDAEVVAFLQFTVGGTGLRNQRIEFEAAPRTTATVAPQIVSVKATFAQVPR